MKMWVLFVAAAAMLFAEQPDVTNAVFESRAFAGSLGSELQSMDGAWFGYAVKTIQSGGENCCSDNGGGRRCTLEDGATMIGAHGRSKVTGKLEGTDTAAVLFRVAENRVEKVGMYSLGCPLDAGGRRFVWITGVPAQESLRYLEELLRTSSSEQVQSGATFAIAQHDAPQVDGMLERLTRADRSLKVRENATFWLGASRGENGLAILKKLIASDTDEEIRDKAVFAISISKDPGAVESLIDTAKHDRSAQVRGQALFWLAQKAGVKAFQTIQGAIENDPDTGVKKHAVFAMSQLPTEQSVPKLIAIARTQRNAEVRKQAFFWLGQSKDPRALAFFEEVLAR